MRYKVALFTIFAIPLLTFAQSYIKSPRQGYVKKFKPVAVVDGIKAKVAVVKGENGYKIVVIEEKNSKR